MDGLKMSGVDPHWWKTIFDETYLTTDARSVCDESLTSREVDFLVRTLDLERSWPILDLCGGQGRHSLELSRRGFRNVTVLDYSHFLVRLGKKQARREGLDILFVRSDARDPGLPGGRFRVIIIMAGSFGYFVDEAENIKILSEASRLLAPGGSLLLDLPSREYVLGNFTPRSWHEADKETVVCRQRRLDGDLIYSRELVISKRRGQVRDSTYCIRLYTSRKIRAMLTEAGFDWVNIQDNFVSHERKADYGLMSNRMIVIARKK